MPPEDDGRPGRVSTPSLTERVKSLASRHSFASPTSANSRSHSADGGIEDEHGTESGDGGSYHTPARNSRAARRPPSTAEPQFRDAALLALDKSQPHSKRISSALVISKDLAYYSAGTAFAVWSVAEDLAEAEAPLDARKAAFHLLEASASLSNLSLEERGRLYELISQRVDASEVGLQVKSLGALTRQWTYFEPFQEEFVMFLGDEIQRQFSSLLEARRRLKGSADRKKSILPEERALHDLLNLVTIVLDTHPDIFVGNTIVNLVKMTISIAEKTASKDDMKKAVRVLRTVIRLSRMPSSELKPAVEILCAISNAIVEVAELTWESLMSLLSSRNRDATVRVLLDTLALAPSDRHSHTVCGALGVICYLVMNDGAHDLPTITFSEFIESLWEVHFASRRIRRDCLKAIVQLLRESDLTDSIINTSWDHMIQIILTATGDETYIHNKASDPLTIRSHTMSKSLPDNENFLADDILVELKRLAALFNSLWTRIASEQRQLVRLFYYKLRLVLPADSVKVLIAQLADTGYYNPGTEGWQNHQHEMLDLFLWDEGMDAVTASVMINVLASALNHAQSSDLEHFHELIIALLKALKSHYTLKLADELANLATSIWERWQPPHFADALATLWPLLKMTDSNPKGSNSNSAEKYNVNTVSVSLVGLFLSYMEEHAAYAIVLYDFLIEIIKALELSPTVRLPPLRLLTRLRCDRLGRIMIIATPDSLSLASTLCRTESSIIIPPQQQEHRGADRSSLHEDQTQMRSRRTNTHSQSFQGTSSRASMRTSSGLDRSSKQTLTPPLWMYPGGPGLPREPPSKPSRSLFAHQAHVDGVESLKMTEWLIVLIDILQQGGHWEVYSYVLVHLPSQLSNPCLFTNAIPHIKLLRSVISSQLQTNRFQEPPADTNVKKGDVALCLFHALTMLINYTEHFARAEQDDLVRSFLAGIDGWDRTAKTCIHALAISCHQIPWSITKALGGILQKMAQIITQSNLAMDILEFLGGLARLPSIYVNFREEEFRHVFAICVRYLEHAREQRLRALGPIGSGVDYNSNRLSGISSKSGSFPEAESNLDVQRELPQYLFALAHHVLTVWFLSVRLTDRSSHVGWITKNLAWVDQQQNEIMEEQSQVTLDMMHRTAYLDLGETVPLDRFTNQDGQVLKKTWLLGLSIVTIETATGSGLTQITKRQASGTTYATYQQQTAPLPPHHVPLPMDVVSSLNGPEARINIFPNHVFLQLTSTIAPTPTPMEPICLPDDDATKRALSSFDRNDTVDGYKVGVIYVGNGQHDETAILANTKGSQAFDQFVQGLGTKVQLKGANFNTQGLDTATDMDGTHTYAWRDRIAEVVFHIPTMMPTDLTNDPLCTNKKRHIGNDFVNIIFNESGLPFRFDTFHSQFNYVNVVITPDNIPTPIDEESYSAAENAQSSCYYTIQTISSPSLPRISPAASAKLLPLASLPALARQLALNSSVFSNVWATREGGEHISSWRNRLREIVKLRARFVNTGTSTSTKYPGAKSVKKYESGDVFRGRVEMGGLAEEEGVLSGLDFSRWAGPNPPLS